MEPSPLHPQGLTLKATAALLPELPTDHLISLSLHPQGLTLKAMAALLPDLEEEAPAGREYGLDDVADE